MKEIILALISFRVVPTIGRQTDNDQYQFYDIDSESKLSLLDEDPQAIGIVCGQSDVFALKIVKPKSNFVKIISEKLGLKEGYRWIVESSKDDVRIVMRVYSTPGIWREGSKSFAVAETFAESLHVIGSKIPLVASKLRGVEYKLVNGSITAQTPPHEIEFAEFINVLAEYTDVSEYQKPVEKEQEEVRENHVETPILPLRALEKLPNFFKTYIDQFRLPREKDISLLSMIATLSACLPNVISRHRNKKIWAHLYVVITAPPASGKGSIAEVIRVIQKIERAFRDSYDAELKVYNQEYKLFKDGAVDEEPIHPTLKTIQLPTDTSFIALFEQLVANGESGLMFETEIDSFINAGKQEWGNYSLLNRKATHHEPHLLDRKTLKKSLYVESPKIAMVMSGTPNQFFNLFRSAEDGLYSRFLVYCFQLKQIHLLNPFVPDHQHFFDSIIEESANFVQALYNSLSRIEHEIEFRWTSKQAETLYNHFSKMLSSIGSMYGESSTAILLRYMLAATRIGMVLTAIEEFEKGQLLNKNQLQPGDHVVDIVTSIIDTCMQHSLLMLANIQANSKDKPVEMKSLNMLRFLNALPERRSFKTEEAISIARSVKVSVRSAGDYLNALCNSKHLERIGYGEYRRLK